MAASSAANATLMPERQCRLFRHVAPARRLTRSQLSPLHYPMGPSECLVGATNLSSHTSAVWTWPGAYRS